MGASPGLSTHGKGRGLRSLHKILRIAWQNHVTNTGHCTISCSGLPSMYSLLIQRRLCWLGHLCRMEDSRIPKDILYGELTQGKHPIGIPIYASKSWWKETLQVWSSTLTPESSWLTIRPNGEPQEHIMTLEARQHEHSTETRRMRFQHSAAQQEGASITNIHQCDHCGRQRISRIGLHCHKRRCSSSPTT